MKITHMTTKQFRFLFLGVGILSILIGLIHFNSWISSSETISLWDGIFNSCFGILYLVSGFLITRKNAYVIVPFIGSLIASVIYSYLMGRGLNYLIIFIDFLLGIELYYLIKNGIIDFDGLEPLEDETEIEMEGQEDQSAIE